jgi:predicted HTH transcriptional regulator
MNPITFGHVQATPAKPAQKSIPGSFATGKGTTQRIKDAYAERSFFTSKELGDKLGVPSRQLSKRLAELVKSGYLKKAVIGNGSKTRIDFQRVA